MRTSKRSTSATMKRFEQMLDAPTPTATTPEQLEALLTTPVSEQVLRLFESGAVNDTTTFGELGAILAQDALEQTAVNAIKDWFETFDGKNCTAEDGEVAANFMMHWWLFDSRDFTRCLAA